MKGTLLGSQHKVVKLRLRFRSNNTRSNWQLYVLRILSTSCRKVHEDWKIKKTKCLRSPPDKQDFLCILHLSDHWISTDNTDLFVTWSSLSKIQLQQYSCPPPHIVSNKNDCMHIGKDFLSFNTYCKKDLDLSASSK